MPDPASSVHAGDRRGDRACRRDRLAREAEEANLSPAATRSSASRGRARPEEPDEFRTAFERDRDRIIHSKAFRRLKHKTQVFLNPEGDHFVTRLTHTMQVTQVARSLAAALSLNEPLAEAIALGHDVGHSPFGHTGEDALSPYFPPRRLASRRAERPDLRGPRGRQPDLGGARRDPGALLEDRAATGHGGGLLRQVRRSDRLPRARRARRPPSRHAATPTRFRPACSSGSASPAGSGSAR